MFRERRPGIYHTWKECNDQVKKATFKRIKSLEEAKVPLKSYFGFQLLGGTAALSMPMHKKVVRYCHDNRKCLKETHGIAPKNTKGLV